MISLAMDADIAAAVSPENAALTPADCSTPKMMVDHKRKDMKKRRRVHRVTVRPVAGVGRAEASGIPSRSLRV